MNKLFKKIGMVTLGLSMVLGVGVGIGVSQKGMMETRASSASFDTATKAPDTVTNDNLIWVSSPITITQNKGPIKIIIYHLFEVRKMVYGYIRVSTDNQTVENQRFEIKNYLKRKEIKVDIWVEETISGTKNFQVRKLGKMIKKIKKNDIIICTEISRLGRSLLMIMEILNILMNKGAILWTIKDGYSLGYDIQSKVLAFAFGISAEIERKLISQRTKEALARIKSEGKKLGRPKGSKNKANKLDDKRNKIDKYISRNYSVSKMARLLKVHYVTMQKYLDNIINS